MTNKSSIWENKYLCDEKYRYETALYLLSMLSHVYNIVIYRGVGAPGHGKYVVDGFNVNVKKFFTMLMTSVQLPGAATNGSKMLMHT